jgi:photosystem II stability/assembly factor-like uncharacterized protein
LLPEGFACIIGKEKAICFVKSIPIKGKTMKKLVAVLPFLCVVIFSNHIYAAWTLTNGPYGGNVTALAKEGNNIYAGTYGGGVFRSTDNGNSWMVENNGLPELHIAAFAIKDHNVFAGTTNGVFLSQDSGNSWKEVSTGLESRLYGMITPNKSINTLVFSNDTLFTKTNGYSGFCGFGLNGGVFFSIDSGVLWKSDSSVSFPQSNIGATLIIGNSILAGTTEGVFLSSDNGATWGPSSSGMSSADLSVLAYNEGKLFVGSKRNTFISNDGGDSWTEKNDSLPRTGIACLAPVGNMMFAGTDSGVFVFSNASTYWEPCDNKLFDSPVLTLFPYGNKLFATKGPNFYSDKDFFESNTMGKSWGIVTLDSVLGPSSFAANDNKLYAFIGDNCLGICSSRYFISSDSGVTWTKGATYAKGFISAVSCSYNIFGLSHAYLIPSMSCPSSVPPTIYVLRNNDTSWTEIDSLKYFGIQNLASINGNLFAVTQHGIFLSPDNGSSWTAFNEGLTALNVHALAFSDKEIFAATEAGLWRRPLSEMPLGIVQKFPSKSKTFDIAVNNGKILNYTLAHETFVSLNIYDIRGRLVCAAINKRQPGGTYSFALHTVNLSAGNYLCKFITGNYVVQKRFVILR